ATRTAGNRAKLVAPFAYLVAHRVEQLRRKRSFAHPGAVGLGHTDYAVDGSRGHPGSDDRAPRRRTRRSHEGIGTVIDVEHGSLRTFEHHRITFVDGTVQ